MQNNSYIDKREKLQLYFDKSANKAWEQLTSDAPVSRIRQTVRDGRNSMRDTLLSWMPEDLQGKRVLDAGCGTGSFAVEAAHRGADVCAIDISPSLIEVARSRTPKSLLPLIEYRAGDMLSADAASFDYVVAMDSLIHYQAEDMLRGIESLLSRAKTSDASVLFTFAPRTPMLMLMKKVGAYFPQGDRSPAIEPVAEKNLKQLISNSKKCTAASIARTHLVSTAFYKSQALELTV